MQIIEFLKELSEASGVSGYEAPVRDLVQREFEQSADEVRVDAMGSLIALKRGAGAGPGRRSVMLAGHMDEIGFLVSKVEDGFLRFATVGGFDLRVLPGQEVSVHGAREIPGVIATRPPHVLTSSEQEQVTPLDGLFIDVGLSKEELQKFVHVGDVVNVRRRLVELANGLCAGKALDDRAAVVCIDRCLQVLKSMKHSWDVYAVATVQEETGLKGAMTSAFGIDPDIGIAIDVGHGNMPGIPEVETMNLGGGPAIALGPNIHPALHARLVEVAKSNEISYQIDPAPGRTGTDAWSMQVTREGIPTALLSIPLRYMHTSVETLVLKDLERTGRLLALFIAGLDEAFAQAVGLGPVAA